MLINSFNAGAFLTDLRSNRPTRPTGARPPPASFGSHRQSLSRLPSTISENTLQSTNDAEDVPHGQSRRPSISQSITHKGRPMIRSPSGAPQVALDTDEVKEEKDFETVPYIERGSRWMEKQEAKSLRQALEHMDLEAEKKLHADAQKEASELVWKHQNPGSETSAYHSPDLNKRQSFTQHLRQGSYAKTTAKAFDEASLQGRVRKNRGDGGSSRSVSGSSKGSASQGSRSTSASSLKQAQHIVKEEAADSEVQAPVAPAVQPIDEAVKQKTIQVTSTKNDAENAEPILTKTVSLEPASQPTTKRNSSPFRKISFGRHTEASKDGTKAAEPTTTTSTAKVAHSAVPMHFRNPFARVKSNRASLTRVSTDPTPTVLKPNRIEIHRNPPSQSRNAGYTSNQIEPVPVPAAAQDEKTEEVPMKDGLEIRSEDIRKATSMSLKDRSAKLPTPSMVSDSPGRPIVSFDQDWKPKEVVLKEEMSQGSSSMPISYGSKKKEAFTIYEDHDDSAHVAPLRTAPKPSRPEPVTNSHSRSRQSMSGPTPSIRNDMPPIPTIAFNDQPPVPSISVNDAPSISITPSGPSHIPSISVDAPSISVSPPAVPTISIDDGSMPAAHPRHPSTQSQRPLPAPSRHRPHPTHTNTSPAAFGGSRSHAMPMPTSRTGGVLCTTCALPIAGRIVTAAGSRFHPECFRCYVCSEALECVAFYPEPTTAIQERNARMLARETDPHSVPEEKGKSAMEDEKASLSAPNFYCHLDYHELFSPRCKSCKTPIEGEVVIACGAEWHVGHFFCAQCGDPFSSSTPFVEKDGYAWCVGCHTNRFSAKCAGCRKPVVETVLKALGKEWHEGCFCCTVSTLLE